MQKRGIYGSFGERLGDVEADFWLAFDLLRSAKDHAEFVVVRDWVRSALHVRGAQTLT